MDEDDIKRMMREVPAPEQARERLRERLEVLAWDAKEGHLEEGETAEVVEKATLRPDPMHHDEDLTWTLTSLGGQSFRVSGPDGEDWGEIELEVDEPVLDRFSDPTVAYHREEAVKLIQEHETVLMPLCSKMEVTPAGDVAIYTPDSRDEPRRVVEREDVSRGVIAGVFEEWRNGVDL